MARADAGKVYSATLRRFADCLTLNTHPIPSIFKISIFILRGCAHGRAAHAEARGEQFLSMLRPLNSLKISKR